MQGAEEALSAITHCFGPRLLEELPSLWDAASRAVLLDPDQATSAGELDESSSGTGLASRQQEIIDTLQVLLFLWGVSTIQLFLTSTPCPVHVSEQRVVVFELFLSSLL